MRKLIGIILSLLAIASHGFATQATDASATDALPRHVQAYFMHPSDDASHAEARTDLPMFDVSDAVTEKIIAMQGVKAAFPTSPPEGYTRDRGVSFRKTVFGRITPEQQRMNEEIAACAAAVPSVYTDAAQTFDVPTSLLGDVTYIGTLYHHETNGHTVMFLIRISTPEQFVYNFSERKQAEIRSVLSSNQSAYVFDRDLGDTSFRIAIPEDSLAAMIAGNANTLVVNYEVSTDAANADVLPAFLTHVAQ